MGAAHVPHILVVDDNPDNRDMYSMYPEYTGFAVEVAGDGLSAFRQASASAEDRLIRPGALLQPLREVEVGERAEDAVGIVLPVGRDQDPIDVLDAGGIGRLQLHHEIAPAAVQRHPEDAAGDLAAPEHVESASIRCETDRPIPGICPGNGPGLSAVHRIQPRQPISPDREIAKRPASSREAAVDSGLPMRIEKSW